MPILQKKFPALLINGNYEPHERKGPAIWLKCMVMRKLPEANWNKNEIPIIYLPGVSKTDFKNIQKANLDFQPLIEYQYTGTIFSQENGKEWTIMAFLQNSLSGLGVKVAQDAATKNALIKSLSLIFEEADALYKPSIVDTAYLNNQLFPDIVPTILKWMCKGDNFLTNMDGAKREVFISLCKTEYGFDPDHRNIKEIAEKLGGQRNAWKQVWQHYSFAPQKFQEISDLLQLAKPSDLGSGMFAFPEESWPQVNEAKEGELRKALISAAKLHPKEAVDKLKSLETQHGLRRSWVWSELGQAP